MESLGLLWQMFALIMMTIFEKLADVVDDILFTLGDYGVYDKVVKVRRKEKKKIYPSSRSAF